MAVVFRFNGRAMILNGDQETIFLPTHVLRDYFRKTNLKMRSWAKKAAF
jgi:hypothetical protein